MSISEMLTLFLAGFLTSFHCIGMCGPLIVAYSLCLPKPEAPDGARIHLMPLIHHAAYHAGRLTTYGLLGGAAGWCADQVIALEMIRISWSSVSLAGGAIMVLIGLGLMGIVPFPQRYASGGSLSAKLGGRALSALLASSGAWKKLLLGVIAGFLPCMPLYAIVVRAMATASFGKGFGVMFVFGLGTVPALLFLGVFASAAGIKARILGRWLMGLSIIAMGALLIYRGT